VALDRKKEEEYYLKACFDLLGLPIEAIVPDEAPDFRVTSEGRRLGVELTYYRSSEAGPGAVPRRNVEALWKSLDNRLWETVVQHLPRFTGILFFKELKVPRTKEEVSQFTADLESLLDNTSSPTDSDTTVSEFGDEYPALGKYLRDFVYWTSPVMAGWGSNITAGAIGTTEGELIETVRDKCLHDRPGQVDEFWLLVHGGWRISENLGWIFVENLEDYEELNKLLQKSRFDRVLIYAWDDGRVLSWRPGSGWVLEVGPPN